MSLLSLRMDELCHKPRLVGVIRARSRGKGGFGGCTARYELFRRSILCVSLQGGGTWRRGRRKQGRVAGCAVVGSGRIIPAERKGA